MSIKDLLRRLDRIETNGLERPTHITSAVPLTEELVQAAIEHWREWVADGRASKHGGHLHIMPPRLTTAEWSEKVRHYRGDPLQ